MTSTAVRVGALGFALLVSACGPSSAPTSGPASVAPPTLVAASEPPPTPVPFTPATRTAAPATASPTATTAPTPSPAPTPTASPTPSQTPVPTAASTAPPTAAPTRTLKPGETPKPTPIDLTPFLQITLGVVNLADDDVTVAVDLIDPDSGDLTPAGKKVLAPFDQISQKVIEGDYRITFTHAPAGSKPATCDLHVKNGDAYQFAIIADDVAIAKQNSPPTRQADLFISSTAICRKS